MINAEFFELQGHARHLKYAALACPHFCPDNHNKNVKETALHSRAVQEFGRTVFVVLTADWRTAPVRGSKVWSWYWHIVVVEPGKKATKLDLHSSTVALLGEDVMKKQILYWKPDKDGRMHGFVRIGKKLEKTRLPKGL